MLIPSFFYETHRAHHSSNSYGTANDGEYLPLSSSGWWGTIKFLSEIFVLPFYFVLRFSIGTPLSMFSPRLREYLLHHHSSLVIDLKYEREIPDDAPRTLWACIELACFVRIALILVLISVGVSPWTRIVKLFAISFLVLGTNHLRTLSAHRYRNQGHQMTHDDQFADSTNIEGNMFTELFCPLGLRYHALHHLLPRLPYHNLRAAHRLLSQQLPADSRYHQATYRSCSDVMREFFANLNEPETRQTAGTSSTEN